MYNLTSRKHKHTWIQKISPLTSSWSNWFLLAPNISHSTHYAVIGFYFIFSFLRVNEDDQANCTIALVSYTRFWSHHSRRMCHNDTTSLLSVHSSLMSFTALLFCFLAFRFVLFLKYKEESWHWFLKVPKTMCYKNFFLVSLSSPSTPLQLFGSVFCSYQKVGLTVLIFKGGINTN